MTDVYIRYEPEHNSSFVLYLVPKANGHKIAAQFYGDEDMSKAKFYAHSNKHLRLVCPLSGKQLTE